MPNEANIIEFLQSAFAQPNDKSIGIGDDAACFPKDENSSYVISKDLLLEDVHFRRHYAKPEQIAHKALHVNLSDIAAMGAKPLYVLLGIALPADVDNTWINAFLQSFTHACQQTGVRLIGGDTTESKSSIYISVTIIGTANNEHLKFRAHAQVNDRICVVGDLGEAHAGLIALEKNVPNLDAVKERALMPQAKTQIGEWLGKQRAVTAMMDISDGLYIDLSRLCKSANKGAHLQLEQLKPSALLQKACAALHANAQQYQLIGGEDYALLFTVNPQQLNALQHAFTTQFATSFAVIGEITTHLPIILTLNGDPQPFEYQVFSHFGELK
jgi:thiamine-monophosphate kinase